jgi:hypothetical protein
MRCRLLCFLALIAGCGGDAPAAGPGTAPRVKVVKAPAEAATAHVQARIRTGASDTCSIVAAGGSIWVASLDRPYLLQVDPERNRVTARIRLPQPPCAMRVGNGLLWLELMDADEILAVDPRSARIVRRVRVDRGCIAGFVLGRDGLWVVDHPGLSKVSLRDARTGVTRRELPPISGPGLDTCALARAGDSLWVGTAGPVLRVDPQSGRVRARIGSPLDSRFLLVALGDELWVGNFLFDEMRRIDVRTGREVARYEFGGGALAATRDDLWAVSWVSAMDTAQNGREPTLVRLDRRADRAVARYLVGRRAPADGGRLREISVLGAVGVGFGSVWVAHNLERRLYRLEP